MLEHKSELWWTVAEGISSVLRPAGEVMAVIGQDTFPPAHVPIVGSILQKSGVTIKIMKKMTHWYDYQMQFVGLCVRQLKTTKHTALY